MEQIKSWEMRGEYCETCNCDILCPCLPTNTTAMPTQVHCDVMLAYHIEHGSVGDVSLDGLSFVIALQTPGAMIEGHAKVAIYIDEKANDEQRRSLEAILGGESGGPPSVMMDAMSVEELKGFRFVPIVFGMNGNKRTLEIPGIMQIQVEGIEGLPGKVMEVRNTRHPANSDLALAKTITGRYEDFDFDWDNAGKNGHYAPFNWNGG